MVQSVPVSSMLEMRDIDSISPPFLSEESKGRALLVVVFFWVNGWG